MADTRLLRRDVLRPHQTLDEIAAAEQPGAFAVGVVIGGAVRATGLIAPDARPGLSAAQAGGPVWRIRGMATHPASRGQGLGTAVLAALVAHAADHGAARVWANARTPALNLYLRAGFTTISDEFELPQIGPHFRVELTL